MFVEFDVIDFLQNRWCLSIAGYDDRNDRRKEQEEKFKKFLVVLTDFLSKSSTRSGLKLCDCIEVVLI